MEQGKLPQGMGEGENPEGVNPAESARGEAKMPFKKKKAAPGKLISILSWIVIVALLVSTGVLYNSKNMLTEEKNLLQNQLEATLQAKAAVQEELEETTAAKQDLETTVDEITAQAQALAREVEAEKAAKRSVTAQLGAKVKEIEGLRRSLQAERAEKTALTQGLTELTQGKKDLQEQLEQLKVAKESLEKRLKVVLRKSGVRLEKIVVKPEEAKTPSVDGEVLVVNREFDFVVINLGFDHGLDIGSVLEVFSGEQVLGKVQIEKIYGNMSAATILPESQKDLIREGHSVRVL